MTFSNPQDDETRNPREYRDRVEACQILDDILHGIERPQGYLEHSKNTPFVYLCFDEGTPLGEYVVERFESLLEGQEIMQHTESEAKLIGGYYCYDTDWGAIEFYVHEADFGRLLEHLANRNR